MVKTAGTIFFGFVLHIGALLITIFSFCFSLPLTIGFSFLLEMLESNPDNFLIAWAPNLAVMLFVYSFMWLIAMRYWKFTHVSAAGALVLNLFILFLYFSTGSSFKQLATDWNDEGCGPFPNAFVFLCFSYSTVLLPVYLYSIRRWVMNSGDQWKKRLLFVFSGMAVLLFALVMTTYRFVQ